MNGKKHRSIDHNSGSKNKWKKYHKKYHFELEIVKFKILGIKICFDRKLLIKLWYSRLSVNFSIYYCKYH